MRKPSTPRRLLRGRALDGEPHKTHQVLAALESRRKSCSMTHIEQDHPFSWFQCFVSLVSYSLLLSDVLRSGPALRDIPEDIMYYFDLDSVESIGPVGYPVNHLTLVNATTQAFGGYWLYKYDTSSVGMRALAQHLQLPSWSPCLLYKARCDETSGLPLRTAFTMIDEVVAAVMASPIVNLRISSLFRDSLHHYATPWFFESSIKQSIQAARYDWQAEQTLNTIICDPRNKRRPYMCAQTWANRLKKQCAQSRQECRIAGGVSVQILRRMCMLSQVYPNNTIESAIVDNVEDFTRGGMIFPGRRRAHAVLLSRVRSCVHGTCWTLAVDDYRFEAQTLMMNVGEWSNVVALLRVVGQAYIWLRVLLLVWICHVARHNASHEYRQSSRLAQCRTVLRTIFLVPSQVVVYGSLLPISLYYVAHLIDSPATYAIVTIKFNSLLGSRTWKTADIVSYCVVSMRTVWVLSFYCHLIQAAWTRCVWSPTFGVLGISEYVVTFVAALTLFAQYRVLSLRNTAVLEVFEVVASRQKTQLQSQPQEMGRSVLLFGAILDWKCLLHASIAVALICVLLWTLNRVSPRCFPFQVSIFSRTRVPHAASYLWPRNRLVVSWFGSLLSKTLRESKIPDSRALATPRLQLFSAPVRPSVVLKRIEMKSSLSWQQHRQVPSTASRSRQTESLIYLINFAVMTDPITLLHLRFFSGRQVAAYESKTSQECFLLPCDVRGSSADTGIDWDDLRLVAVVNTKDLEWDDLLRSG